MVCQQLRGAKKTKTSPRGVRRGFGFYQPEDEVKEWDYPTYFRYFGSEGRTTITLIDENSDVVDKPVWEVKPKGTYSDETFYVGLGNKFLESIVIPDDEITNLEEYRNREY